MDNTGDFGISGEALCHYGTLPPSPVPSDDSLFKELNNNDDDLFGEISTPPTSSSCLAKETAAIQSDDLFGQTPSPPPPVGWLAEIPISEEGDGDLFGKAPSPTPPERLSPQDTNEEQQQGAKPLSYSAPTSPAPPLSNDSNFGLEWVEDGFSLIPRWTVQPTIESIVTTLRHCISPEKEYEVAILHEGLSSKLYTVTFERRHFVMRICLPLCPKLKTESEVATLRWVKANTRLPVPQVRAYDSTRNNPIGFEWILMTKVDGKSLRQQWHNIGFDPKERIVKALAEYATIVFKQQFDSGIGNLFQGSSFASADEPNWQIGQIVSKASRLRIASLRLTQRLSELQDESHCTTARQMLQLIGRLEKLEIHFLRTIETGGQQPLVPTMLWHFNISLDNIFVDDNGILCGIVDWQDVSCLPLRVACYLPVFMQQQTDRELEPMLPDYWDSDTNELDSEYLDALRQYELTYLRRLFVEEMRRRCPDFIKIWRSRKSSDTRDYECAVQNCDNELTYARVATWVDAVEGGKVPGKDIQRLHDMFQPKHG
ncbi:phosphotransferase enzyme family-domain-containing protein [Xylariaceae sp. FL0016]|nr:phosphotransferase enzyme family-domain-containing protein [Xylariaceae sp. FL0016]